MFSTWVKKTTVIIIILISLSFSKYGQSIPSSTLNCLNLQASVLANNLMYASVPGKVTITDSPTLGYLTIHVTPGYNYAPNPLGNYQFIPVTECMSIVAPSLMMACNQTGILKPAEYLSGLPSYSYAANTSSYCEMKIPYSAAPLNCPAGQISVSGGVCTDCPGGMKSADGKTCPAVCTPGKITSANGIDCEDCPAGTSSPAASNTSGLTQNAY